MNKFTLERIFSIYAKDIKQDEEIARLISRLQADLSNRLNDEELAVFNKYEVAKIEESENLSRESFKQGFRASVLLMLDVLNY